MSYDKVPLNREEVDKMLEPGDYVHTFKQAGPVLVGCNWNRNDILELAERGDAEMAGAAATAMNHGVVVWDKGIPTFCATRKG